MTRSQMRSFTTRISQIAANAAEKETDQVDWRTKSKKKDDAGIWWFQIEVRVINPDDDFDSGWGWADGFGIGPRGKIHG